jgi:branched-chain amino acid transport system permease protein
MACLVAPSAPEAASGIKAAWAQVARRHRLRPCEALPWVLALGACFVFPDYLFLGTQVLILIMFALSLDLILGYAGIITLGHAAYFGLGAYVAGMLSAHAGWHEPLSGLVLAGLVAAAFGWLSGLLLLRYHGLALLMLTLALGIMMMELANVLEAWTGGFDGLYGITPAPLLGRFENDLYGRNYYVYSLVVLFLVFVLCRRLVHSPFGLVLQGVRDNERRMRAIGCDVLRVKVTVFTIAAGIAGLAGGLFAQANAFVSLDALSFMRSGTVLIVLILGGAGRLYGAFVGATSYYLLEDQLAKISPEFWQFGVGLVLVLAVLFGRGGLLGLLDAAAARWRRPLRPTSRSP